MLKINKLVHLLLVGLLFSFAMSAFADATSMLFRQRNNPVAGNPAGKITVVEFFDYQCGHCVSMAPVIGAIIKANPDVRVVFKDFPIRGPISEFAARAALAANQQGKYYPFSHALLEASDSLTEDSILALAKKEGLNVPKLKKDMNDSMTTSQLNANMKLAEELQINGTPAFYIGKTNASNSNDVNFVLGEMSQSELQAAIDKARQS